MQIEKSDAPLIPVLRFAFFFLLQSLLLYLSLCFAFVIVLFQCMFAWTFVDLFCINCVFSQLNWDWYEWVPGLGCRVSFYRKGVWIRWGVSGSLLTRDQKTPKRDCHFLEERDCWEQTRYGVKVKKQFVIYMQINFFSFLFLKTKVSLCRGV